MVAPSYGARDPRQASGSWMRVSGNRAPSQWDPTTSHAGVVSQLGLVFEEDFEQKKCTPKVPEKENITPSFLPTQTSLTTEVRSPLLNITNTTHCTHQELPLFTHANRSPSIPTFLKPSTLSKSGPTLHQGTFNVSIMRSPSYCTFDQTICGTKRAHNLSPLPHKKKSKLYSDELCTMVSEELHAIEESCISTLPVDDVFTQHTSGQSNSHPRDFSMDNNSFISLDNSLHRTIRRRLIHTKREARNLHAPLHSSQNFSEYSFGIPHNPISAEEVGLVLPPTSK